MFQVYQQTGNRLVDLQGILLMTHFQVTMLIPLHLGITMRDLDEANPLFRETTCQQALTTKILCHLLVQAVKRTSLGGFVRDIFHLGHRGLHPEGKLEAVNTGFQLLCRAG